MLCVATAIPEVLRLEPRRFTDARGAFSETYSVEALARVGVHDRFVQDNQSVTTRRGVVRGLHFQAPPHAQAKLVRVVAGAIYDVAVDIRIGSPTYGRGVGEVLSGENGRQLLVPVGFAHGFMTLTDEAVVLYKCTSGYAPEAEGGLLWSDPALGLDWPEAEGGGGNARDEAWPRLADLRSPFTYEGAA